MKTIFVTEPDNVEIRETEIPVPKEDEALLKIKYCGICGSDLLLYKGGHYFATYPRIPGHEFSAEIVQISDKFKDFKVGEIVTANPYFNCGKCYPCSKGKVNCCEHNETMGVQRDGSFSQYIVMPVSRLYHGRGVDAKKLALVEPFSIGYHAMERVSVAEGENVLIIGAGPIGIFTMLSAKQFGAKVYVSDVLQDRLDFAMKMGADGVHNVTAPDFKDWVNTITNNNGMDVCAEASGNPQALLDCIDCACFGGRIAMIGNGKKEITFNHSILLKKELNLYGSRNSVNDFIPLIDIIKKDKINVMNMVTDEYNYKDVKKAFDMLDSRQGLHMKVLLDFSD